MSYSPFAACIALVLSFIAFPTARVHFAEVKQTMAMVRESQGTFRSEGKDIAVEHFEPRAPGPHPAVLLLHGCDGLTKHGPRLRDQARYLAKHGYVCLLVHYFDRDSLAEVRQEDIRERFPGWMLTVLDALKYTAGLEAVDAKRVGLVGHSLGAYLALSVGLVKGEKQVAAVVDYYGGLPGELLFIPFVKVENMPPTLILHGERDEVVPVKEARDLEKMLKEKGRSCEMVLYPSQGHVFQGADEIDSARRSLEFLDKRLKPETTPIAKKPAVNEG
jgi:carboxymethylenebutenolidase